LFLATGRACSAQQSTAASSSPERPQRWCQLAPLIAFTVAQKLPETQQSRLIAGGSPISDQQTSEKTSLPVAR